MTTLPEPDSSPARRPESLLDVSVPHRAGAIVSEFISSIVGEAESRAAQIVIEAEDEAGPRRQAALDAASRVREYNDALAELLAELRSDLRRESDLLYADPRVSAHVQEPPRLPAPDPAPTPEGEPPVQEEWADAGVEEAVVEEEPVERPVEEEVVAEEVHEEDVHAEDVHEEEEVVAEAVVEEEPAQATETMPEVDASLVPASGPAAASATAHETSSRFARMTDEELARAHANAVKAAARDPFGEQAESMRRLAEGALEEALRRPAFATAHPVKVSGRRRSPLARRKRAREEALAELREACQRARLAS